jgi:tetratricopeptide (TPR) repeat protein
MNQSETGDHIEQTVNVGEGATTGDIKLIGKWIEIISNPAEWQDIAFRFLSNHRYFLLFIAILELGLLAIFLRFYNLYLLPGWSWWLAAALLLAAGWCSYTYYRFGRARRRLFAGMAGAIALGGLTLWQAWPIARPLRDPPELFVVAVAEVGRGGFPGRNARTQEITDEIYERLCDDLERAFEEPSPCRPWLAPDEDRRFAIRRLGVMPDSETARAQGRRVGADLVLWGRLLTTAEGDLSIHFEILETLDQVNHPDFPAVLPVKNAPMALLINSAVLSEEEQASNEAISQLAVANSATVLGFLAYLDHNFPETADQLERAIRHLEADSEALNVLNEGLAMIKAYLGRANHRLGRVEQGQELLEEARALDPQEPSILISLALGYGSLGEEQLRDQALDDALDLLQDEDNPNALFDRGLVHEIRREDNLAVLDYEALVEQYPDFYLGYVNLGAVRARLGRDQEAIAAYQQAIALARETSVNAAWAYARLADVYFKLGQVEATRSAYREAVRLAPTIDQLRYAYATFLEKSGEVDAALQEFEALVDVSPQKAWAYTQKAMFEQRQNLLDAAIRDFLIAIGHNGDDPLTRVYLAQTYDQKGDMAAAREALEAAAALNEEKGIFYVHAVFGNFLFKTGEWAAAAEQYERSLALRPNDVVVMLNYGRLLSDHLGQPAKAAGYYRQILATPDDFPPEHVATARERLIALGEEP